MKPISSELNTRLIKKVQTPSTNADPSVDLWISRIDTPLKYDELLEKKTITSGGTATDCDIAVKHTKFGRTAQEIYMAYVMGGTAKVAVSPYYEVMRRHEFTDSGFSETASKVAIAFDGTMPKTVKGVYEFLTEDKPWVFWINSGALYGKKLGDTASVILAESNATAVTATRAMWSEVSGFDFGLCVFFILSDAVYYRQLIDGIWYDAAPVPVASLPTLADGVTWVQIDASRTWDYRVVLQLVDSTGKMYEVYTQYGGIGSKNAEHIEIKDISADGTLTEIKYHDTSNAEHIEISNITAVGKLRIDGDILPLSAANSNSTTITVLLNSPPDDYALSAADFAVTDSGGGTYACSAIVVDNAAITLTVADFNYAYGSMTVNFTGGVAGFPNFAQSFAPQGIMGAPRCDEHIEISNITATGTLTAIQYQDAQAGAEHIEITGITATGVLTHINDI